MDPATIIGTTAAILDFIDDAWKLIRTAYSIYGSVSGSTIENERLEDVTSKMTELSGELQWQGTLQPQSTEDARIADLAEQCRELCQSIIDLLQRTKTKKIHSLRQSLKAAALTIWTKGTIADLQNKLLFCTNQLNTHLTAIMR